MAAGDKFVRGDGRRPGEARSAQIQASFLRHAEGSASIRMGNTWVVCSATVADRQPAFLRMKNTSQGWITAEYGMLPRSVPVRLQRGRPPGREMEIQRLVGRCLRTVVDLDRIPLHTITIDCDVVEADGGTRAAAITGAFVALCEACLWMVRDGRIREIPVKSQVAAISVGLVRGRALCDLSYAEDSDASVDMSVIMTGAGELVGLHASAETAPLPEEGFRELRHLAHEGLGGLFAAQRTALGLDPGAPFDPQRLLEE